ncbi:hypothetical protein [uncultured Caulobacter sp.]|uniref:hypothetical protein n=1 Tax=uncultured Caulobacter sp. TaxID=158749 RepID=UPI0026144CA7|nr:hypothetical protein [uncultured Caulobacter sp.]
MSAAHRPPLAALNLVHQTPGEPPIETRFSDPAHLAELGFAGDVLNDFGFLQTALTFEGFDPALAPPGSAARARADARAEVIRAFIDTRRAQGLKAYVWADMIVLPRTVLERHGEAMTDARGRFDLSRPATQAVHRAMADEIVARFPGLSGVVIRTGETYLHNTPDFVGNNPADGGAADAAPWAAADRHALLLNLLREGLCERGLEVIYRTWAFGGVHTDPDLFLRMSDQVAPHPRLSLAIKHTAGDFHRGFRFNPTLGLGRHPHWVEVQCQREYEGKGVFPNYIAQGVIDGFEERAGDPAPRGLGALDGTAPLAGLVIWSRGGGWAGPRPAREFWCALNAAVLLAWSKAPEAGEAAAFDRVCRDQWGLDDRSTTALRRLCLLSASAVLRGRSSLLTAVNPWWTRDEFLGGVAPADVWAALNEEKWCALNADLDRIDRQDLTDGVLAEKDLAVDQWREIVALADQVALPDPADQGFLRDSCEHGLRLHQAIAAGWRVMLIGQRAGRIGRLDDKIGLTAAVAAYETAWRDYEALAERPGASSFYQPRAFDFTPPDFARADGLEATVRDIAKRWLP